MCKEEREFQTIKTSSQKISDAFFRIPTEIKIIHSNVIVTVECKSFDDLLVNKNVKHSFRIDEVR